MNAVGIDSSKGKSMVAALRPMGEAALLPMEATGRCHEPAAAAWHEYGVCVLNPLSIRQSGGGSIRRVRTDKTDAVKIARYGPDNRGDLQDYTPMDTIRQQLKLCSRP